MMYSCVCLFIYYYISLFGVFLLCLVVPSDIMITPFRKREVAASLSPVFFVDL